ncbi:MAG: hypothetical protein QXK06_02340 [Candidatus Diapherotrites archaeon]
MLAFFLFPAFLIGLIASIEDFKQGIIRNLYVLTLLILGITFQFLSGADFFILAPVLASAFVVSFAFWLSGLWPAGDAKLFWAYFFFFPQTFFLEKELVLAFLSNIFVPIFFFMFFVVLCKSRLGVIKEALKYSLDPYRLFMLAVMLLGFVWIVMLPLAFFRIETGLLGTLAVLLLAFELLKRFWTFKTETFFILCAFARVLLFPAEIYSIPFAINFLKTLAVFVFFRFFILYLAFKLYASKVLIKNLKEGMIPAEGIKKQGKKFVKESFLNSGFISFVSSEKKRFEHSKNCLSKKDIAKLQRLEKRGLLEFDSLLVHQTQPFGFFILLGFLLTLLFQGKNFLLANPLF